MNKELTKAEEQVMQAIWKVEKDLQTRLLQQLRAMWLTILCSPWCGYWNRKVLWHTRLLIVRTAIIRSSVASNICSSS